MFKLSGGLFTIACLAGFLVGCSSKQESKIVQLASNRTMGVLVRKVELPENSGEVDKIRAYFQPLIAEGLRQAYQSRIVELKFSGDSLLETPENLYQIGKEGVDEIVFIDVSFTGDFYLPPPTSQSSELPEEQRVLTGQPFASPTSIAKASLTIYNGSNLRTVTVFHVNSKIQGESPFTERLVEEVKRATLASYPNPNIYPKNNPTHYANLLYNLSRKREDDVAQGLTCELAEEAYKYYEHAAELYQLASSKGLFTTLGKQEETHALQTKLEDAREKTLVRQRCIEEKSKTFEVIFDFGNVEVTNQSHILKAYQAAQVEEMLKKYTQKPVKLSFRAESDGSLTLILDIRFIRDQFLKWASAKAPARFGNYQILTLEPYYALMQRLVVMKASLAPDAPPSLKNAFLQMKMNLVLSTTLNGELYFGVDGTYLADRKAVRMAYPNTIYVTMPGFDRKTVSNKSEQVFQEKGWIALGNCKTLDGTMTEDGLAYKFFGFPCP